MSWYLDVWKSYATFYGRARRKEYWMFFLINLIVMAGLGLMSGIAGDAGAAFFGLLYLLFNLAIFIPSLAVGARRLHDTGRSGWWQLIVFVPLLGVFILLIFLAQNSQPGKNAYGLSPKGA